MIKLLILALLITNVSSCINDYEYEYDLLTNTLIKSYMCIQENILCNASIYDYEYMLDLINKKCDDNTIQTRICSYLYDKTLLVDYIIDVVNHKDMNIPLYKRIILYPVDIIMNIFYYLNIL